MGPVQSLWHPLRSGATKAPSTNRILARAEASPQRWRDDKSPHRRWAALYTPSCNCKRRRKNDRAGCDHTPSGCFGHCWRRRAQPGAARTATRRSLAWPHSLAAPPFLQPPGPPTPRRPCPSLLCERSRRNSPRQAVDTRARQSLSRRQWQSSPLPLGLLFRRMHFAWRHMCGWPSTGKMRFL